MTQVPFSGTISGPVCQLESPKSRHVGGTPLSEWDPPKLRFLWKVRKQAPRWWDC